LEYLGRAERNYDLIDLRPMPAVAVEDLPGAKPLPSSPWARAAMIDLAGSWDTYWESRKQDHNRRRNVERCERRLSEAGCITFERYRPAGLCGNESEPRWDLFDECVSLARRSWQSGLTEGNTLSHPDVLPLLRDAHQAAAQAGALDMSLLRLNDQPLAFSYGYHYRGNFDLLRIGFDPDWAKLAPGNALWTRLIRDSFQRKDRVIDLGPTCLDFKKFWLTRVEPSFRLLRYTWSPRSQVLRVTRLLRGRAGEPGDKTNAAAKVEATQPAPALVATSADGTDRRDRPAR
jgi:CelD/BcsL family acetyltransferase involved in cellulose biosynthesis